MGRRYTSRITNWQSPTPYEQGVMLAEEWHHMNRDRPLIGPYRYVALVRLFPELTDEQREEVWRGYEEERLAIEKKKTS